MENKNSRYVIEEVTVYYAETIEEAIYAIKNPSKIKWEKNYKITDWGSDQEPKTPINESNQTHRKENTYIDKETEQQ